MSEATSLLIDYLVDKLFPTLFPMNGSGGGNGNKADEWEWIIQIVIFVLKYIIVLFVCRYLGTHELLNQFLLLIVPRFLKWMIEKMHK